MQYGGNDWYGRVVTVVRTAELGITSPRLNRRGWDIVYTDVPYSGITYDPAKCRCSTEVVNCSAGAIKP